MNAKDLLERFECHQYTGQTCTDVTYFFRAPKPIRRLSGESDILYIGKTAQGINSRYRQETRANNSPGNTQQTNIRTTYIFRRLEIPQPTCFFIKVEDFHLQGNDCAAFLEKLRFWDKKFYIGLNIFPETNDIVIPLEKYLLISYADEHLEVPPLNNRV